MTTGRRAQSSGEDGSMDPVIEVRPILPHPVPASPPSGQEQLRRESWVSGLRGHLPRFCLASKSSSAALPYPTTAQEH